MSDLLRRERAQTAAASAYAALAHAIAALQPISNSDTFGHLAQGRAVARSMSDHGQPPTLDPFSFAWPEPRPWVNYEWLSDWLAYVAYEVGGWNALIAGSMTLAAAGAAAVVWIASREGGARAAWVAALLVTLAVPAARFRMSARPHLVTLPLAATFVLVLGTPGALATRRRAAATVAILVMLQVLWANLHGSHLLGVVIVGAAMLSSLPDRRRASILAGATVAVTAASCMTPYSSALARDAIAHVFDPAYRAAVTEWHDITNAGPIAITHVALTTVGLVVVARTALRAGPDRRTTWMVALVLAVGAIRSMRFVAEAVVLAAAPIAAPIAAALEARAPRLLQPRGIAAVATAFALVAALATGPELEDLPAGIGVDLRMVPAEAASHIERDLPGARVLASMPSSWYLLWAAPSARVLIDGRTPFYGVAHLRLATDALERPELTLPVAERFGANVVLLQHTMPSDAGALAALSQAPDFACTWIDGSFAVFARRRTFVHADAARFDSLPPRYDARHVLGADDAAARAIRQDLAHLGPGPDAQAFGAFVRAMLRARPFAREAGWAGYRPPVGQTERAEIELARRELAITIRRVGSVPVVLAQKGLLDVLACRLDDARAAFARARAEGGDVRETIFGEAEIDLRRGEIDRVRAFLADARAIGGDDAWIVAIEQEIASGVRCEADR